MSQKLSINGLVCIDLKGFKIAEMTEVYRVDEDGRKSSSLGFFRSSTTAEAFAGAQTDASWHRTRPAFVLTDGKVGYVIDEQVSVKLFNDEQVALDLRNQVIAKLSPAERSLLGF